MITDSLIGGLQPSSYWHETDRRIAREQDAGKQVARAMNADNILLHAVPFGTARRVLP